MRMHEGLGRWARELCTLTLGVLLATHLVDGIRYEDVGTLALVVVVLVLLNTLLKPAMKQIFVFLSLPLILVTFGLALVPILWGINAVLFYVAGILLHDHGFHVGSFTDAMFGALIMSAVSCVLSLLTRHKHSGGGDTPRRGGGGKHRGKLRDDDVIDV